MRGILLIAVVAGLCIFLSSCWNNIVPAQLTIAAKLNGVPQPVTCQILNVKGNQVGEMSTGSNGVGYFTAVPPGTYTFKFCNDKRTFYPAVKTVTLAAGVSLSVQIELSSPTGDAPVGGIPAVP